MMQSYFYTRIYTKQRRLFVVFLLCNGSVRKRNKEEIKKKKKNEKKKREKK